MDNTKTFRENLDRLRERLCNTKPSIFEEAYCSVYKPPFSFPHTNLTASILDILTTDKFQKPELINLIRQSKTKDEADQYKRQLWGATFSSVQADGQRGKDHHLEHSGFIQFDIDNIRPEDIEVVKYTVMVIPYTAYVSRSARGKGVWGLFKISEPEQHREHFNAMEALFKHALRKYRDSVKDEPLEIDTAPSSVASLRFICCDKDAYINPFADVFTDKIEEKKKPAPPLPTSTPTRVLRNSQQLTAKEKLQLWNNEVSFDTIHNILIDAGWIHCHNKGDKVRYTRPGKDKGVSADYHTANRTFFIWSSEAPEYNNAAWKTGNGGKCGSPLDILMVYGTSNWKEIYSTIDTEFGLK